MARGNLKKNYLFNVFYRVLSILTPLITTPYVSRILKASEIGKFSYTSAMVTYFTLFAGMGTALFGRREVSYFQDDREKRSDVFWNTEILSCISCFDNIFLFFVNANRLSDFLHYFVFKFVNSSF